MEPSEIYNVNELYSAFESDREKIFQKEMAETKRREVHQKAKRQLKDLLNREELLANFEKRSEIMYAAWLAPRSKQEKEQTRKQDWQTDIDNLATKKAPSFLDERE